MDLILCWCLLGAWTGIDWNEFNSLSELKGVRIWSRRKKFGLFIREEERAFH